MYKQGDIVAVHYPLTDKPAKTKLRPALIVSGELSNNIDKDVLVCPLSTKIRQSDFSYALSNTELSFPLPENSEIRCNKIMTIRVWDKQIIGKLSEVNAASMEKILAVVKKVFEKSP
ncbi:type II toxin-antitoxin system PemK/MazF family toxin [Arcticibacter tournemirensis]